MREGEEQSRSERARGGREGGWLQVPSRADEHVTHKSAGRCDIAVCLASLLLFPCSLALAAPLLRSLQLACDQLAGSSSSSSDPTRLNNSEQLNIDEIRRTSRSQAASSCKRA